MPLVGRLRVPSLRCGGPANDSIEQMNTEQPGPGQTDANHAWQALVSDINAPNNLGFGDINYWVVEGTVGAVEKFTRNGGASIKARRIGSASAENTQLVK